MTATFNRTRPSRASPALALRGAPAEATLRAMEPFGRILVIVGLTIAAAGALLWAGGGKVRFLPGDISIERENFRFYFPIVTCVVVSLILTVLFRVLRK